jgi:hypothetical protein
MDPISMAFAAPIECDLRAQTKNLRCRPRGYFLPWPRVPIFGDDSNIACAHRTNNSIRTRDAAGARGQRCPGEQRPDEKLIGSRSPKPSAK